MYRENRVPYYQRLYQANEGVKLWQRVSTWGFLVVLREFVVRGGCWHSGGACRAVLLNSEWASSGEVLPC